MADQAQLNREALEKHNQKMRRISRMEDHTKVHTAIMEEREAERSSVMSHPHSNSHSHLTTATIRQRKISRMRTSKPSMCGISGTTPLHPPPRMENSYRMEPTDSTRLREGLVRTAAEDAMKQLFKKLDESSYDTANGSAITCSLADDIKARVRRLGFPRHKLVVHVIMGQQGEQSMQLASRCLWDVATDGSVTVCHEEYGLYAVAIIYAAYFE